MRTPEVSQIGAPCPDHLINTKHKPLMVEFDPEADGPVELADVPRGVGEFARWYRDYYERNSTTRPGSSPSTLPDLASFWCPASGS